jgi:hypothetical protein
MQGVFRDANARWLTGSYASGCILPYAMHVGITVCCKLIAYISRMQVPRSIACGVCPALLALQMQQVAALPHAGCTGCDECDRCCTCKGMLHVPQAVLCLFTLCVQVCAYAAALVGPSRQVCYAVQGHGDDVADDQGGSTPWQTANVGYRYAVNLGNRCKSDGV